MNWLQLLKAAASHAHRTSGPDAGQQRPGRILLWGAAGAVAIPTVGLVMLGAVLGGVVASVVMPFSMFAGLLPQSVPPDGLIGPPAPYWSTFQAAQAQYHVPVAGLMALAQLTSQYRPDFTAADGNAGLIAMPPSLFAATAARHHISLDPGCPTAAPAEKTAQCTRETTAQEMANPQVEILVAAAALSDAGFAVVAGNSLLPGKVTTAIAPFLCGTDPSCDTTAYGTQVLSTMGEYYNWLEAAPARSGAFRILPHGGAWNQLQAGTFPLPGATGSDPFPYAQCTWWAYYQDPVPGVHGNAYLWAAEAAAAGVTVIPASYGPLVGEVVVFARGGGYSSRYGHVAYVAAVRTSAAGAILEYEVSQANVPEGAAYGTYADIPWPDPHVLAFLPPTGEWDYPLSYFTQTGG
jgi:hypothetical protein